LFLCILNGNLVYGGLNQSIVNFLLPVTNKTDTTEIIIQEASFKKRTRKSQGNLKTEMKIIEIRGVSLVQIRPYQETFADSVLIINQTVQRTIIKTISEEEQNWAGFVTVGSLGFGLLSGLTGILLLSSISQDNDQLTNQERADGAYSVMFGAASLGYYSFLKLYYRDEIDEYQKFIEKDKWSSVIKVKYFPNENLTLSLNSETVQSEDYILDDSGYFTVPFEALFPNEKVSSPFGEISLNDQEIHNSIIPSYDIYKYFLNQYDADSDFLSIKQIMQFETFPADLITEAKSYYRKSLKYEINSLLVSAKFEQAITLLNVADYSQKSSLSSLIGQDRNFRAMLKKIPVQYYPSYDFAAEIWQPSGDIIDVSYRLEKVINVPSVVIGTILQVIPGQGFLINSKPAPIYCITDYLGHIKTLTDGTLIQLLGIPIGTKTYTTTRGFDKTVPLVQIVALKRLY